MHAVAAGKQQHHIIGKKTLSTAAAAKKDRPIGTRKAFHASRMKRVGEKRRDRKAPPLAVPRDALNCRRLRMDICPCPQLFFSVAVQIRFRSQTKNSHNATRRYENTLVGCRTNAGCRRSTPPHPPSCQSSSSNSLRFPRCIYRC